MVGPAALFLSGADAAAPAWIGRRLGGGAAAAMGAWLEAVGSEAVVVARPDLGPDWF
jgi:hypothetical protein